VDTLMYEMYSERSAAFDPHSHAVILATLDQRLHRGRGAPAPPEAAARVGATGQHPRLVVSINDAGQSIVGGQVLDGATLDGLLRLCFTDDPDTEIVANATRRAPHAAVVDLFDRAKAVGLQRLSVTAP
jgi:biopolymer transport protein ExbD